MEGFPVLKPALAEPMMDPKKATQSPVTTGTSVVGVRFNGGIVLAADTLASYGSLARFRNCQRMFKVNESTMLGCSGDYADYQYLKRIIEQVAIDDDCKDDGFHITPKSLYSWLQRVLYNKRSKFDPLWTTFVVAGIQDGKEFLGFVNMLGLGYQDPVIATGYGAYIATPILRNAYEAKEGNLTQAEAVELLEHCMRVVYYRDARAHNKYEIGIVRSDAGKVSSEIVDGPELQTNWDVQKYVVGYE